MNLNTLTALRARERESDAKKAARPATLRRMIRDARDLAILIEAHDADPRERKLAEHAIEELADLRDRLEGYAPHL